MFPVVIFLCHIKWFVIDCVHRESMTVSSHVPVVVGVVHLYWLRELLHPIYTSMRLLVSSSNSNHKKNVKSFPSLRAALIFVS